ncbi:hypothetical protein LTR37_005720 [Vermiconidia calcicola]|uniref:Uncharacterized protein n=1 Tax=Vermiconidia calcicola TaxID=1690605 RepID=A0ACC3NIV3_9PEZI|nr:hypothetical protein LTR37_005720 [Vermiconidia calcicola]
MAENDKKQDHNTESRDSVTQSRFKSLMEGAERMHANEQYTDLIITCSGHEWKVHKFCLCAQSDFFHSACGDSFKEGNGSKINLDDDDPQTVEALIHYFCCFDYGECANISNMILDARMYAVADKYFVALLKQLAKKKFESRAKAEWKTVEFADAVAEVFSTVPEGDGEFRRIA